MPNIYIALTVLSKPFWHGCHDSSRKYSLNKTSFFHTRNDRPIDSQKLNTNDKNMCIRNRIVTTSRALLYRDCVDGEPNLQQTN